MNKFLVIIFVIVSTASLQTFGKLPPTIPVCSRHDPNLSGCIIGAVKTLRPRLASGDLGPGLNVPPLEPFTIPQINFGEERGLQVFLSNVQIRGASTFVIEKLRVNFDELKMDILLTIPKLDVSGKYKLNLNFLGQPVKSDGDYFTTFEGARIVASLKGHKFLRTGVEFARIEPVTVKFQRGRVSQLKLTNLFGGNRVLSEIVHALLINNPDYVLNNIYPQINAYLSRLATDVATKIIEGNALDELFPH